MQATQTVPHVVSQLKPGVLSIPKAAPYPETITQLELAALLSLRGRLRQLVEQIHEAEQGIRARLETGAVVELGDHFARIDTHERRNVAWKEVVIRLAERLKLDGAAYCARVLAATKPTQTTVLVIE